MTHPITPDLAGPLLTSPPPAHPVDEVLALARAHFGLTGQARRLTSERDLNLFLDGPEGRFVVKVTNAAEPAEATDFQTRALRHIASRDPALPVPRVVPALDGCAAVPLPGGHLLRVLSWVEGLPMHQATPSDGLRASLGGMAARLTRALEGFAHPAAAHVLQWDIKQAAGLRPMLPAIADPDLRALATDWIDRFDSAIAPRLPDLPWQVVHADLNPHNVLMDPDDPASVAGVLDFGDMVETPRICDLAVAASYHCDPAAPVLSLAGVIRAWHRILPMTPGEQALILDLAAIRMVTTITLASWRAARYPDNAAYILRNLPASSAGLQALSALPRDLARSRLAAELESQP
ncbi:aminotransferase [Aliigemmobacter aestuarii]|uniref:Hydroxylysine kinase n=1 Tax=Aliigemmobacter aestuarii TaxID=1445661 RepID=A0A4S3MN64_9RHOB|nr:phosphotransferase [Gemmobacter aestuarii]THD83444.1 aminotransferase [Gemmobacter aestuarii]